MVNGKSTRRMAMYKDLLEKAVEKRKENITAKELSRILNVEPTSLYRLERGTNDIRVSTFLAYLDGFGFTIEVVPNSVEKASPVDMVLDGHGSQFAIENLGIDVNDRRQRLRLLQYILKLEQSYLDSDPE